MATQLRIADCNDDLPDGEEEFVALITQHQTAILAYLLSLVPNHSDAEDLLQRTNLVLWRKREKFEIGTSFRAWAFSIARWEARAFFKDRGRKSWLLYDDEVAEVLAERLASVPPKGNELYSEALGSCLGKLSDKNRQLIVDRYQLGLTYHECAEKTGRSEKGLRVTLHRLRVGLRKCVTQYLKQLQFAYDHGFRAWEDNRLGNQKPELQEKIGAFMKEKNMALGVMVITGGNGMAFWNPTDDGLAQLEKDMRKGVEVCKRTGQTNMTMLPGIRDKSMPLEEQFKKSVDTMKRCCDIVEEHGIILAQEPLSHNIKGGAPLIRSFEDGFRLCELVNRKSCKLLADFFHEGQIGNGDKLIPNAEKVWSQVSYVQYGDSPGRKEPGTGKLDYTAVTKWLREKGFEGIIGMEHGASAKGAKGLDKLLAAYRAIDA